jgi:hypothetical protein
MKLKFLAIAGVLLLAIGYSVSASAGTITDFDVDLIPDVFDNCVRTENGPDFGTSPAANQQDTDDDGIGNACDCDFTQDGFVLTDDIGQLFANFNSTVVLYDNTGDGFVLTDDVARCFARFNSVAGDLPL